MTSRQPRTIVAACIIATAIAGFGERAAAQSAPGQPAQPSQPTQQPAQPTQPTQPGQQPAQSAQPSQPGSRPAQPTQPTQPGQPPVLPEQAGLPTQPAPAQPAPTQPASTPDGSPTRSTASTASIVPPGAVPGVTPAGATSSEAAAVESFYRLQATDIVLVQYRYTPEYNATVSVRPDGYITLPLIGEVRVGGLTVSNAQREILKRAEVRLRDPELTVELKDFQKPRFVVGGEVGKPGQFDLRGRVTVLEAVAMAGGLKPSAKHSQIVLFRRYDEQRAVTRVVNAKELAKPESMDENPVLMPGDFLFVPQNRISKVERFIPVSSIGWILNILVP